MITTIEACKKTSTYEALEAVARFIKRNYLDRHTGKYEFTKVIRNDSGRLYVVTDRDATREKSDYRVEFQNK